MNGALLGVAPGGSPALADFLAFDSLIAPRAADIISFPQAFPSSEPVLYPAQYTMAQQLGTMPLAYAEPAGALNTYTGGSVDSTIDSSAADAISYGKPILLVLADEFNGNWTQYGYPNETAAQFIAGFQYIVNRLRVTNGATNIKIVWAPNIWLASNAVDPSTYYPGDAYVDYIALDGFVASTSGSRFDPSTFFLSYYNTLCGLTNKPFMFASIGCAAFTGEWGTNNLVTNGGFETFDSANQPHGWTVSGTATAVTQGTSQGSAACAEGSHCCVMNHSTGTATISQTVNITAGTPYHLGFYTHGAAAGYNEPYSVQVVGGASNGLYLQSDSSWNTTNGLTYSPPTSGLLNTVTPFTPPAGATAVTISFSNTPGTCWLDAISISDGWTSSYKQWWYQQLFSLINTSMPRTAILGMWNQSGSDGDYRIDSSGADALSKAAFKAGVSQAPFVWEHTGTVAI